MWVEIAAPTHHDVRQGLHQPRVIRRDKNVDVIRQHNGVTCMLMHLCVKLS